MGCPARFAPLLTPSLRLSQMHQQGILKTDDLITRFFRLCTEMCVEISYRAQAEQQHNPAASAAIIRAKCYHNLDAFVRLIALLVKHSGEATNTVTKINLLNKVRQPDLSSAGEKHQLLFFFTDSRDEPRRAVDWIIVF